MDQEPLTADDAAVRIRTASVTIKALRVGKRQMTLSMFRQLEVRDLVDEEGPRLMTLPWGWVNYHCGEFDPWDRQFVCVYGPRLFRCPFPIRFSDEDHGTQARLSARKPPEWCRRWDDIMCELLKIEQLFIAV